MKNSYFLQLEECAESKEIDLNDVIDQLGFNEQGLIPVIAQDDTSKQVLMLAWMNKGALLKTLTTGDVTYWSRSRQQFWIKGATSGNTQKLVSMSLDCDGDAILCHVNQQGGACHTGRVDCFYLTVDREQHKVRVPSIHVSKN